MFSISSVFFAIARNTPCPGPLSRIWKMKAPPRVVAFGWLALHGGILTMDNLRCRKKIIVNACPMCLEDDESVDHLLIRCKAAREVWSHVLRWFDCSLVFPTTVFEAFDSLHLNLLSARGRIMWRLSFLPGGYLDHLEGGEC